MSPSRLLSCSRGTTTRIAIVPRTYPATTRNPAMIKARGMSRRGRLISLPMNDAASAPENAESMVAQMPKFATVKLGLNACGRKLLAGPNLHHAISPRQNSRATGIQVPIAPRLLSHFPMFSPTIFTISASTSPTTENVMKKDALLCRPCQRSPPTYNALLAAK